MKEIFSQQVSSNDEINDVNKTTPQFLKEYSRKNSQEDRNAVAAAIRKIRRKRDAWRVEHNAKIEAKNNIEAELMELQQQVKLYADSSFLGRINDYFQYRKIKFELNEKFRTLYDAKNDVDRSESEQPEFQEVKALLENFYNGEKEKWKNAGYTSEDIKREFAEERLSKLSIEDYVLLLKRFPSEMLTHVTRQGIRDHTSSIWHTAGAGKFSNGFKNMLADGRLRSSLGIALQEHSKEDAIAKFLHLDTCKSRDEALAMYRNKFEYNLSTGNAFADSSAVHFASESVIDSMYGSETGNEIFIAYPSAYIASQLLYGGKGTLSDKGTDQHNDKWIYTKNHEGMPLDIGIVFIPEDAMVDPNTGSRYKINENGEAIVPQQRINEILDARFKKNGFIQTFIQQLPYLMKSTPKEEYESLVEAAFEKFGIIDIEARKALLDPDIIYELANAFGTEDEYKTYEKILSEYFHKNTKNPYELAENPISSREYWEKYFQKNPNHRPSKVVYYKGDDPSRALNEWRENNGIVKRTEDITYGFPESNILDSSEEANIGKDEFASLALKVINNRFPI